MAARAIHWLAAALMMAGCNSNDQSPNPAIAAIEKLDGRVEVDDKLPGRPVVVVDFDAKGGGTFRPGVVTDQTMDLVQGFDQLRSLNLSFTDISDVGLGKLKGLTSLETLTLYDARRVTSQGLEHLEGLVNLKRLDLGHTGVTDDGLKHLRGLTKLESLNLHGTRITDAGLAHLEALPGLRSVRVGDDRNRVTDQGIERLSKAMPNAVISR